MGQLEWRLQGRNCSFQMDKLDRDLQGVRADRSPSQMGAVLCVCRVLNYMHALLGGSVSSWCTCKAKECHCSHLRVPVTNYWSAHDVHTNRAIDKFFEADGSRTNKEDSIWTYHVWNEVRDQVWYHQIQPLELLHRFGSPGKIWILRAMGGRRWMQPHRSSQEELCRHLHETLQRL